MAAMEGSKNGNISDDNGLELIYHLSFYRTDFSFLDRTTSRNTTSCLNEAKLPGIIEVIRKIIICSGVCSVYGSI